MLTYSCANAVLAIVSIRLPVVLISIYEEGREGQEGRGNGKGQGRVEEGLKGSKEGCRESASGQGREGRGILRHYVVLVRR